jgi:hypothetical protein
LIYNETDAVQRVAENCNAIQALYAEIRELADYHDIEVELRIPIENDGIYSDTINADYNVSQWNPSGSYNC